MKSIVLRLALVLAAFGIVPNALAADNAPTCEAVESGYEHGVIDAVLAARDMFKVPVKAGDEGTAVVAFDLQDGSVDDLHMLSASNIPAYDQAANQAVKTASLPALPPQLSGFTLHIQMPLGFYSDDQVGKYVREVEDAVNAAKIYPKIEFYPDTGTTSVISFDVLDSSADNLHVDVSTKSLGFDRSAFYAVKKAVLPPAPPELHGRKIHVIMPVDFRLDDMTWDYDVKVERAVESSFSSLGVAGRPIKTSEVVISLDALDGLITDMHVSFSSGDPQTDQETLDAAAKAKIPAPPPRLRGCKVRVDPQRFLR